MHLENKQSIGRRISLLVLCAVFASVLSATGFFLQRQTTGALDERSRQLTAVANVLAAVVSSHVKNNDGKKTLNALRAISKIPSIPYALVSRQDGTVLAELGTAIVLIQGEKKPKNLFSDSGKKQKLTVWSLLKSTAMPISVPVIDGGQQVGNLQLIADVSDLHKSLTNGLYLAMVAVVIASLLGMSIASQMKRKITRPITDLAKAMSNIRKTHDFSTRVERQSDDETGLLVDSFNDMLSHISDRDESLAEHRKNLEQTVTDRTRELVVAKNAAEQANKAKSDFLATMSHEIRTPMNGVLVMAELLASGNLLPRQQRYAEVIVHSGQSLLTIINDILDLSKIEAGKLDLEKVPLSPAGIVDDVVRLFWQKATGSNIDIASFVDRDVPIRIIGDPVRLNQVLSNLVNNALKFTETGYVAISIKTIKNASGSGFSLEFSVVDTGVGIAPEKMASVFQEFTQADQSTTRKFGGTGLGLSICKKLVAAMGGQVDVESLLHKGSRFYFTIPVEVVEPAPQPVIYTESKLKKVVVSLEGIASRQSIVSYLRTSNIDVELVHPAEIAIADFSGVDAIFLSSQALETLAEGVAPFVIAVSQLGDATVEQDIREGRVDDLLMRPVGRLEMLEMIDRLARGVPRGIDAITQADDKRTALPQFASSSVLVADDNAVNREVIIEVLAQLGVKASVAKDGKEAVEAWMKRDFDLIFMDCSMPVMDGYAATGKIREMEQKLGRKNTPIIALTAHIAGDNREKWRNAGMNDYITKPFAIKTIAERMGLFLPQSAADHDAGKAPGMAVSATSNSDVQCPPDRSDELPVLDGEVLADLRESGGGSNNLLNRVFELFADNAPASFADIQEVSDASDKAALADAAHALKSMCANIGAAKAAAACHRLELAVRQNTDIDVGVAIAEISATMNEALGQIKQIQVG